VDGEGAAGEAGDGSFSRKSARGDGAYTIGSDGGDRATPAQASLYTAVFTFDDDGGASKLLGSVGAPLPAHQPTSAVFHQPSVVCMLRGRDVPAAATSNTDAAVITSGSGLDPSDPLPMAWCEVEALPLPLTLSAWHGIATQGPQDLEAASHCGIFVYVLSIDGRGNTVDVTSRYAKDWLTLTGKLRVPENWWAASLAPLCTADHHATAARVEQ
jgi:hypothetical protein